MRSRLPLAYISLVIVAGALILLHGIWTWGLWTFASADQGRFLSWCLVALAASGMKVQLPAVAATMSLNFLFVLIGIAQFNLGEALVMGCLGVLVQCVFQAKTRLRAVQVAFSVASVACSIQIAYTVHHAPNLQSYVLTAATYFLANTVSVAIVIALTERRSPWSVWRDSYLWSFPNYLVGAAGAWAIGVAGNYAGWQATLVFLPIFYLVYRSHNLYIGRLEEARKSAEQQRLHAKEVAALHRRTIETLALAVEAKDQNTRDHLERVETYAIEVGRELGMSETELEALSSAALLHDIGKLAVPEYIISKPGKLTPDEFETMKTHTIVGAEIVERIGFRYGVAPMVRGHHEKWNGTGYPDGLAGRQIPLGARILAAVDCLDALTTDRQYRRAMPLSEAIEVVRSETGKSFDPQVAEVLIRRHLELNAMLRSGARIAKLPVGVKVDRGDAPATGFETLAAPETAGDTTAGDLAALNRAIGEGNRRTRFLRDFTLATAHCGDRDAVFATLRCSLRTVVPYDAMAVYLRRGAYLLPECTDGDDFQLFTAQKIPLGQGLSGWVAENGKSIANGNPTVEPGFLIDPQRFAALQSALAAPMIGAEGIVGVVSLYRKDANAFTDGNLTALTLLSAAITAALEPAARHAAPA
jgi:putative nucleotidyltransferase with HDIG domain